MTAVTSSGVTALAASASGIFEAYWPLSAVLAGFGGFFVATLVYLLWAVARSVAIRAKYNRRMYETSGFVDPMSKTFEDKRIYLNDFCLPSHPLVEDKTFINCQIIGPANMVLETGNSVSEQRYPICDAVVLKENQQYFNAVIFRRCIFRQCSFQRTTILIPVNEYHQAKTVDWLNWITENKHLEEWLPGMEPGFNPNESPALESPQDTQEEKPQ